MNVMQLQSDKYQSPKVKVVMLNIKHSILQGSIDDATPGENDDF